ncbi:MAG: hypothetical protein ACYTFY_09400 [Planctomycetota bacterium]|jgi:hypothetical protein
MSIQDIQKSSKSACWSLSDGVLSASHAGRTALLTLSLSNDKGYSEIIRLTGSAGRYVAETPFCSLKLTGLDLESKNRYSRFKLSVKTAVPVRIKCELELKCESAWHILPGFLFGDNNLSISEAGHFPNLSKAESEDDTVCNEWQIRADRCAAPAAMAFGTDGGYAAIAGPAYLDLDNNSFIHNGLGAGLPGRISFSLGYQNAPFTFVNKDTFTRGAQEFIPAGIECETVFDIFFDGNGIRDNAADILRDIYKLYYKAPSASVTVDECVAAVPEAMLESSWDKEHSVFMGVEVKGLPGEAVCRKIGGRAIAWVGGVNAAYPLLAAGRKLQKTEWVDIACKAIDKVAANVNPANNLFFDAYDEDWQPDVNYWWSGNTNRDLHSAYTNAETACYLLRAALLEKEKTGNEMPQWYRPALTACDVILELQGEDGNCGYAYFSDRPAVASWDGFAGCWWAVAFCEAFRLSQDEKYIAAAEKAAVYYNTFVQELNVWGTPMDTWKANDQEGVLAFIQTARRLHEVTGRDIYLEMLSRGAEYEFFWRYLYNTRPDTEPLKTSGWNSCGGSLTSVSNPHIHPMGLLIAGDLQYLYEKTNDNYYKQRLDDSIVWTCNCLEIFPEKTGYGRFGWTGERYCQSDGLLIKKYENGKPASTELGFNAWAAGAMLEGLLSVSSVDLNNE